MHTFICKCVRANIYAYYVHIDTYMHTYTHTCAKLRFKKSSQKTLLGMENPQIYTYTYIYTNIHTYIYAHICAQKYVWKNWKRILIGMENPQICTYTYIYTKHTYIHIRTHMCAEIRLEKLEKNPDWDGKSANIPAR